MTGIPVSDVKGAYVFYANSAKPSQNATGSEDFRQIFDKQNVTNDHVPRSSKRPATDTKQTEHTVGSRRPAKLQDNSREEQQNIAEAEQVGSELMAQATQQLKRIAEELGISEEEITEALTKLDMSVMDLYQPNAVGQLLLEITGESDNWSLVADEKLSGLLMDVTGEMTETLNKYQLDPDMAKELEVIPNGGKIPDAEQTADMVTAVSDSTDSIQTDGQERLPDQWRDAEADQKEAPVILVEDDRALEKNLKTDTEPAPEQSIVDPEVERTAAVEQGDGRTQDGGAEEHQEGALRQRTQTDDKAKTVSGDKAYDGIGNGEVRNTSFLREMMAAGTQNVSEAAAPDANDIMRQIMDYMKVHVKPEESTLQMQLHPESLGNIQIHLTAKEGTVTAHFIAQNESVKAALETQMIKLQESFDQQGVKVEAIQVSVQTQQFDENLHQSRGNQGNHSEARRGRIRRLQLDDDLTEELSQEDQIARRLMESQGNTLDYTV